jgi:hypothetical protein
MQQYSVVGQVSASRTENYAVLSTLGRGTYGVCYKVRQRRARAGVTVSFICTGQW